MASDKAARHECKTKTGPYARLQGNQSEEGPAVSLHNMGLDCLFGKWFLSSDNISVDSYI